MAKPIAAAACGESQVMVILDTGAVFISKILHGERLWMPADPVPETPAATPMARPSEITPSVSRRDLR